MLKEILKNHCNEPSFTCKRYLLKQIGCQLHAAGHDVAKGRFVAVKDAQIEMSKLVWSMGSQTRSRCCSTSRERLN